MHKTLGKSFLKGIRKNISRLIAIISIVLLGVGFLAGLLSCTPSIERSVDKYYDEYDIADIDFSTSYGVGRSDLDLLKSIQGVEEMKIEYRIDENAIVNNENLATKFIQYDFDSTINRLDLVEGRLPTAGSLECAVHQSNTFLLDIKIGSRIDYDGETYTVVGIVNDPLFFANTRQITSLDKGFLEVICYLNALDFPDQELFTNIYIKVEGAEELDSFGSQYSELVNDVVNEFQAISRQLEDSRRLEMRSIIEDEAEKEMLAALKQIRDEYFPDISDSVLEGLMSYFVTTDLFAQLVEEQIETYFADTPFQIYALGRDTFQSYRTYKENANKVQTIALIFPVFFILIAALVVLTTMTRMIEEERGQIGTLKSLGYSRAAIAANYLGYGAFASIIGSILGVVVGILLLPWFIYQAFSTMFILPPFLLTLNIGGTIISCLIMIATVLLVTFLTILNTLREKPAYLMQKKAPKPGKKIFLEYIPFFWNRLKFKNKSALRNVFRYKKHMLMTIIGVAGCTGLLLAGFGLSDSFSNTANMQINTIQKYDMSVKVEDSSISISALEQYDKVLVSMSSAIITSDNDEQVSATLIAFSDAAMAKKFIDVDDDFNANSLYITTQLTHAYEGIMNNFNFRDLSGKYYENLVVTGEAESYLANFIYMGENVYYDTFGTTTYNAYLVNLDGLTNEEVDVLIETLLDDPNVTAYDLSADSAKNFGLLLDNIDGIVIIVVLASAALALTVIYNLTNINIIERNKEIASLKVLGYHRNEVSGYVFKETFILTTMGILVGLVAGVLLLLFLIAQIGTLETSIGLMINWWSYFIAIALTYLFLGIVDFIMYFKLRRISMADSLKSPE